MKKLVLVLLCIAMLLIAGCSSSSGSTTTAAPIKTPQKTVVRTTAEPLSFNPADLSGNGDDVQSFMVTGSGLAKFTMDYSGEHNFAIILKDGDGDNVALLVNEIGAYSGKKSQKLTAGEYTLDVTASGPWTISIS